jgi:hypothetical protein
MTIVAKTGLLMETRVIHMAKGAFSKTAVGGALAGAGGAVAAAGVPAVFSPRRPR